MIDRTPSLDELDAATLTELLREHADRLPPGSGGQAHPHPPAPLPPPSRLTVAGVRAEPLGQGTGFLGELRRLHLTYTPDSPAGPEAPTRLVAKAPTSDPGGREVGLMLDVWAREHRFFAELAPRCPTRVPSCFANLADDRSHRWLLLLADAGDTTAPGQAEGARRHHAEAALAEIATLHRAFADTRPVPWLPGFDRGPLDALQAAVCQAVEPFLQRFGPLLPPGGDALLRRFAPRLSSWAAERARSGLTVVHADFRLDNLVLDEGGTVTVLDWQTALMGHGTMDVASFLATSLTIDDRRAWEDELLVRYADEAGSPLDEVRHGVRQHLLWWMALYANNLSRLHPTDPRAGAMFEHTVQRTFRAAVDHEVGSLLDENGW